MDPYNAPIMHLYCCDKCQKIRSSMCAFCEYQDQLVGAVKIVFDVDVTYMITPIYEGDTWTMYKKLFRQEIMTIDSWTEQFTHELKLFSGPHGKTLWNATVVREKENAVPKKVP